MRLWVFYIQPFAIAYSRFQKHSEHVNLDIRHLISFAILWELVQVLALVFFTPPMDLAVRMLGVPGQYSLPLYANQSLFFHALAVPLIALLAYIVLLEFPVDRLSHMYVVYGVTAAFMLTSTGGMAAAFFGSSTFTSSLFLAGLIISFSAGVALLLGLRPHRDFSRLSTQLRGFDLPKLVLWLCVLSILSAAVVGSFAAMGSQAWRAAGTIPSFGLVKASHEHVIITMIDAAIVILVAEHYGVRDFVGVRGFFGKLGYYLCLIGVPLVTITTYVSVPVGVAAHNAITPSATLLLQGALFFMYAILADRVVRQKTGSAMKNLFRGVFGDPVSFGLLFILFWVNVVVTLPGVYVAVNLRLFRGLPNERPFILGHEHALITLTAMAMLLLAVEIFHVQGWSRRIIGVASTLGYVISTGASVPYVFLDPNPYIAAYMPFIQAGLVLMLIGAIAGSVAILLSIKRSWGGAQTTLFDYRTTIRREWINNP
jgi:hypothetical protein